MRESLGVETQGRNESKGAAIGPAEVGAGSDMRGAPSTDLNGSNLQDLSKSVSVGTRKMVNYAWIG